MARSPARTAPGSRRTALARQRSQRRDGPWAASSVMPFALVRSTTSSPSARASRRCCRCASPCRPWRWPLRSRRGPLPPPSSARRLPPLLLPPTLHRLYIARDADAAGDMALAALTERAAAAGIEVLALSPRRGDFNDDLQAFGLRELRAALRPQLAPQDAARYIPEAAATAG